MSVEARPNLSTPELRASRMGMDLTLFHQAQEDGPLSHIAHVKRETFQSPVTLSEQLTTQETVDDVIQPKRGGVLGRITANVAQRVKNIGASIRDFDINKAIGSLTPSREEYGSMPAELYQEALATDPQRAAQRTETIFLQRNLVEEVAYETVEAVRDVGQAAFDWRRIVPRRPGARFARVALGSSLLAGATIFLAPQPIQQLGRALAEAASATPIARINAQTAPRPELRAPNGTVVSLAPAGSIAQPEGTITPSSSNEFSIPVATGTPVPASQESAPSQESSTADSSVNSGEINPAQAPASGTDSVTSGESASNQAPAQAENTSNSSISGEGDSSLATSDSETSSSSEAKTEFHMLPEQIRNTAIHISWINPRGKINEGAGLILPANQKINIEPDSDVSITPLKQPYTFTGVMVTIEKNGVLEQIVANIDLTKSNATTLVMAEGNNPVFPGISPVDFIYTRVNSTTGELMMNDFTKTMAEPIINIGNSVPKNQELNPLSNKVHVEYRD